MKLLFWWIIVKLIYYGMITAMSVGVGWSMLKLSNWDGLLFHLTF